MIEQYLGELRRLLHRGPNRGRLLAEVEDHLQEATTRLQREGASPAEAEKAAVAAFGPPDEVAAQLAGEQASTAVGWSSRLVVAAFAGFVPVYGFVENSSPPAPWPLAADTPGHLAWKLLAAKYLLAGAGALALVVFLLARGYRLRPGGSPRFARTLALAAAVSAAALAAGGALGAVETVQRATLYEDLGVVDPLTPVELALVATWIALLGLAALAAAAWSLARAFAPRPA